MLASTPTQSSTIIKFHKTTFNIHLRVYIGFHVPAPGNKQVHNCCKSCDRKKGKKSENSRKLWQIEPHCTTPTPQSLASGTAKAKCKPEEQTSFSVWAHDNPQDSTSKISNSTCIGMTSAAWPSRYTALPCYLQHHTEGKYLTLNAVWSLYFTPGLFPLFYPIFSHFRRY